MGTPSKNISFLHSGFPKDCASPNLMTLGGFEQLPGLAGTGFFARRNQDLYYITARHCLTKDHRVDIGVFAGNLHVPFTLNSNENAADYVQFDETISLRHNSEDLPGELVDLLILPIKTPTKDKHRKQLLSRAVKLPPNGEWLDNFFLHPLVQDGISDGRGPKFTVFGFPSSGTNTSVIYPEKNYGLIDVITHPALFHGYLAHGSFPDRFKLTDVDWRGDLNGFSGSPVLVAFNNEHGIQYALAGMAVTGGNNQTQFIKISVITRALI